MRPPSDERTHNGMSASDLAGARWQKSGRSQGISNCVELAVLPDEQVAVRNSRHPDGPALIHTHAEIADLLASAKQGDLDHLFS